MTVLCVAARVAHWYISGGPSSRLGREDGTVIAPASLVRTSPMVLVFRWVWL
jgi:hypothetical protein